MVNAVTTARSGILAGVVRLNASASNIANASTMGRLPSSSMPEGAGRLEDGPDAYRPLDVVLKSTGGQHEPHGVTAAYQYRSVAYVPRHDPAAPFADADGMVAAPDVDPSEEALNVPEALVLFKANLAVIKAADAMTRRMVDTTA